jgi:hypothetical protein
VVLAVNPVIFLVTTPAAVVVVAAVPATGAVEEVE